MITQINISDLETNLINSNIKQIGKDCYEINNGDSSLVIEVLSVDLISKSIQIRCQHSIYDLVFKNHLDQVLDQLGIKRVNESKSTSIKAPMPGKVLEIIAKEGQQIEKGGTILILEAMKMENVLKAEADCTIKKVLISNEDNVEKNQILVELD